MFLVLKERVEQRSLGIILHRKIVLLSSLSRRLAEMSRNRDNSSFPSGFRWTSCMICFEVIRSDGKWGNNDDYVLRR